LTGFKVSNKSDPKRQEARPQILHQLRCIPNVVAYSRALVAIRGSIRRQIAASAHLGPATSVIGPKKIQKDQVWPADFFKDFKEDKMLHMRAQKKSPTASLRRKRSEASIVSSMTPSDLRAEKSDPYRSSIYETILEREAGSYMEMSELGVTAASEKLCQSLLDSKQAIPEDTIFRDDVFRATCKRLRCKNEARIFKDCTPLIVPWVETYATLSTNRDLDIAIESVNDGWNNAIPITKPRPQPGYAIGFRRSAFSEYQLKQLEPFSGDPESFSYLMGTYYMYSRSSPARCKVAQRVLTLQIGKTFIA
jgi:hypothetical protein